MPAPIQARSVPTWILKARRKLPILKIDRAPKARDKARLAAPLLVFRAGLKGGVGAKAGLKGEVGAKAGGARRRRTILRFPHSSIFFQSNCQVVPQVDFGQMWYIGKSNFE